MHARVCGLALTPVKGCRLQTAQEIRLDEDGVRENRRFFLVDESARMLNGKVLGDLNAVVADYDDAVRTLALRFPSGDIVAGEVQLGEDLQTRFFSRTASAREVIGPWSQALSDFTGRPVRLVEADGPGAVDRGPRGAASLISSASLAELAAHGGYASIDARRFRMLVEVDGVAAHEEDGWVGEELRLGEALVRFTGHVGRCLITSRDPDTGQVDVPTLDILSGYRSDVDATEPLPFGIYGTVVEPGTVRVGDGVTLSRP